MTFTDHEISLKGSVKMMVDGKLLTFWVNRTGLQTLETCFFLKEFGGCTWLLFPVGIRSFLLAFHLRFAE